MKRLLIALRLTLIAIVSPLQITPSRTPLMYVEETVPSFPGGESALHRYINSYLRYPESAREDKVEGFVLTRFLILEDGSIGDVVVQKSLREDCDAEAIRAIRKLPKFIPGTQKGKPIRVWLTYPVRFSLEKAPINQQKDTTSVQNQNTKNDTLKGKDAKIPENQNIVMPTFKGGEQRLINQVITNLRYPKKAQKEKIEGKVMARFCILEDGSIGEVIILESLHPACDAEAIRVIKNLSGFTPGLADGKPVRFWYNIPIHFALPR